ncbi:hypothetical protein G5V59_23395 [Nocardioides sp. W3-2-3]|uniref:CPCC family cysteine-rich protein n=1 Tax=Nocardioides convexus TaxID=2712224 RepID=UPI002418A5DC|nr:CPCC family cysteine-rich protein [Nocardioides convexus]NHA01685.1 hypothetical protein [Nocardioides convexus]
MRLPCPCCGHLTLGDGPDDDLCPVCFWEDDGHQPALPDEPGGSQRRQPHGGAAGVRRIGRDAPGLPRQGPQAAPQRAARRRLAALRSRAGLDERGPGRRPVAGYLRGAVLLAADVLERRPARTPPASGRADERGPVPRPPAAGSRS